jgi:Domain of unknown function (DUF4404)
MAGEGLRELLARVHEHLSAGGPLEADVRAQLAALMRDIERTLAAGPAAAAPAAAPRLESLAVRFEASHPALAETLREVIDTLGKGGL